MNKEELIKLFQEHGLIPSTGSLERIISEELNPIEIIEAAKQENLWLIEEKFLEGLVKKEEELEAVAEDLSTLPEAEKERSSVKVFRRTSKPYAAQIESELNIYTDSEITGRSTCSGDIENFVEYFNVRYQNLRDIVRERVDYRSYVTIEELKRRGGNGEQRIIVMVSDKRKSKSGHYLLEVEDPTGSITVLLPSDNSTLTKLFERILPDEVLGIKGRISNSLFIASEITPPDLPITHVTHRAEEQVYVAFLSDLHVGSYLFLEKEFKNFISWLRGERNHKEIAERIKYILIAGDLVDGIGVYPSQEKELIIPDIYEQYHHLSELLAEIPDYVEIVVIPGNHDAVRKAEPQPCIPKELCPKLYEFENIHMSSNPVMLSLHGVKTLVYHGTTLDTIIGSLSGVSYAHPETAMVEYLKRRHLAPTYGHDSIVPENHDYLVLKDIPDIFHCGHVHTNGYTNYRGVHVINSGTWQGRTKYQEQLGHIPTPCKVPIMNLQNMELNLINFSG